MTARRYPNFGRERFESMGKVWVADRSGIHADADDEAWTVAAVMVSRCRLSCVFGLVRCAWAAAGICHSQVRHFEGNFNLAGMEFFFACGGLGVVETTTVDVVRVCVMRVRVRQFLRVCTKPLLYTTAADRKLSCACKARDRLFSRCLFVMPPSAAWHVGSLHVTYLCS